jgi:hypothetical protein
MQAFAEISKLTRAFATKICRTLFQVVGITTPEFGSDPFSRTTGIRFGDFKAMYHM